MRKPRIVESLEDVAHHPSLEIAPGNQQRRDSERGDGLWGNAAARAIYAGGYDAGLSAWKRVGERLVIADGDQPVISVLKDRVEQFRLQELRPGHSRHMSGFEIFKVAATGWPDNRRSGLPHGRRRRRDEPVISEDAFAEGRTMARLACPRVDRPGQIAHVTDAAAVGDDDEEELTANGGQARQLGGLYSFGRGTFGHRQMDVARRIQQGADILGDPCRGDQLELIACLLLQVPIQRDRQTVVGAGRRAERNPVRPAAIAGPSLRDTIPDLVREIVGEKLRDRSEQYQNRGAKAGCCRELAPAHHRGRIIRDD